MKKIVSLAVVAAFALGGAACSKDESAANGADNASELIVEENVSIDNSALTENAAIADNASDLGNASDAGNAADAGNVAAANSTNSN